MLGLQIVQQALRHDDDLRNTCLMHRWDASTPLISCQALCGPGAIYGSRETGRSELGAHEALPVSDVIISCSKSRHPAIRVGLLCQSAQECPGGHCSSVPDVLSAPISHTTGVCWTVSDVPTSLIWDQEFGWAPSFLHTRGNPWSSSTSSCPPIWPTDPMPYGILKWLVYTNKPAASDQLRPPLSIVSWIGMLARNHIC